MPEMTIHVGGRPFRVACQPGEEDQLLRAAELLSGEAETLESAIGRVPESRMLLMAGLMLADKTIAAEAGSTDAGARIRELQDQLRSAEARAAQAAAAAQQASENSGSAEIAALKAELQALHAENRAMLGALARAVEAAERLAGRVGA